MARMKYARKKEPQRISKRTVDSLKPGKIVWDSVVTGLAVRCQQKAKVFTLKYRFSGRQRWYSIGKHGSPWTVDDARTEAKRLLGLVADGVDPAEVKEYESRDITVSALCDMYLADAPILILKRKKRPKKASTIDTDRSNIESHIKPLIGKRPIRSITKNDVERMQQDIVGGKTATKGAGTRPRGRSIVKGGPSTAARSVKVLGAVYTYAIEKKGLLKENPVNGVVVTETKDRERFLTTEELARLGHTLDACQKEGVNPTAIAAIRALIFTGARKNEILGLRWKWCDFERRQIRLPESKTDAKTIPLGAPALDLLSSLPRIQGNPFVFPATSGDGHFIGLRKIWENIRARAGLDDVRIHDLRHSFASVAVAGGDSLYLVGKVLGHRQAKTTEKYAHLRDDPVLAVADRAANTIAAAMKGDDGEVVELPNRKA
jgi:integrase